MGSVLDMLNIINGILFVQITQQDIENVKIEFEKRQKEAETDQVAAKMVETVKDDSQQRMKEEDVES